jgi:predicted nuclease with TOPRIM domain
MNELSRRIGKFSSPEALLKAYESLESEFTKRCQKLKDTEKENSDLKESFLDKARIETEAKSALSDEVFLTENVFKNEEISQKIISKYLEGLSSNPAPNLLGSKGAAPLTPPKRPKSLEEAKKLAEVILNS